MSSWQSTSGGTSTITAAGAGSVAKRCEIIRSGALRQKWRARFIADNNLTLAQTSEHYHNLGDLKAMLAKYFPDWPVTVKGRQQ